MSELCEECGVSRKTGYKWYQRYLQGGMLALSDASRAPKQPSKKYTEETMQKALKLKQQRPKYGPKKIHALLRQKYPNEDWPSPTRYNRKLCPGKIK